MIRWLQLAAGKVLQVAPYERELISGHPAVIPILSLNISLLDFLVIIFQSLHCMFKFEYG